MEADESGSGKITWTITVQAAVTQAERAQQLIEQFAQQMQALDATCSYTATMPMTAGRAGLEDALRLMQQQGIPAAQGDRQSVVERQRLLMVAHLGEGSWQDVVTAAENELAHYQAADDTAQAASLLLNLVEYAMNAADKPKARAYFHQAEQLMQTLPPESLWPGVAVTMTPATAEHAQRAYRLQLERLRNWLF
jgi:hypothetical protein